jgi:hypothetical protein
VYIIYRFLTPRLWVIKLSNHAAIALDSPLLSPKRRETLAGKADVGAEDFTMLVHCFRLENLMPALSGLEGGSDVLKDIDFKSVAKVCVVLDSKEENLAPCRD